MESLVTGAPWRGKRVLVTGHTGFKGAWLVLWLKALGARVAGYALSPNTHPSLWALVERHADAASTIADVRDLQALTALVQSFRPEVVFHLAAQSLVRQSYADPVGTYATNVMGTVHLLEAVRRADGVRAVVNVTSDKCYQNLETGQAYRETDPMGGRDPYSSSKGCAELATSAYRESFFRASGGPVLASARAGNVIGGGDWAVDRIIPDAVRAAVAHERLRVRSPRAIRPWQHVLEPLAGYLLLAERLLARGEEFAEAWNFGPEEADCVPVEAVVTEFTRLWGGSAAWTADDAQHPHEAHFLRLDSSKARSRLGWRPRLRLNAALQWTVEWYRRQSAGDDAAGLAMAQIERYMELVAA